MMSDSFMVPDGYGGWRFPDEKPQKVTYSARTTQHTSDTKMCSCNRSRGYDELKQRYEALCKLTVSLLDMMEAEMIGKPKIDLHDLQVLRGEAWVLGAVE